MNTNPVEKIRLLVIDDHAIVRAGLATILNSHPRFQIVGAAADAASGLELTEELKPEIILLDIVLPDASGIDLTALIRQRYPEIQIVVMTAYEHQSDVLRALDAGAIGFLYKNVSRDQLINALMLAAAHKPALAPEATGALIHSMRQKTLAEKLTERELTILTLTANGLSNSEIAYRLGISRFTVKNHLSSIFDKLGVASRTEATTFALKHGLIVFE